MKCDRVEVHGHIVMVNVKSAPLQKRSRQQAQSICIIVVQKVDSALSQI